jgi:hypothetical protein
VSRWQRDHEGCRRNASIVAFQQDAADFFGSIGRNRTRPGCRAGKEAAEVLRINPGFTIESWKRLAFYKDPKDAEHLINGLRKAGLPET